MAKTKQVYFCQSCGYESGKWMGQCPGCRDWNTFVEEKVVTGTKRQAVKARASSVPSSILEVTTGEDTRIGTQLKEFDRVLGGGIVKGSLVLLGGDPGIGKSTLLLQVCRDLVENGHRVLYASGEESMQQIKMRAERIGDFKREMYLHCETDLESVEVAVDELKPEVVVIDSVQTMMLPDVQSAAGSVSQVREVTNRLMQIAKTKDVAIFIVGHVTKEGTVAGPRTLEHMVDTVLYFEGERSSTYRILRGVKNRFGATNEMGVFEMKNQGLVEVHNPSEVMLEGRPEHASGSVVVCSMEGTRPLLIEIQALVCDTNFQMPRRTTVGIDYNRVNLLIAVLEKRVGMHLGVCDAYVNLTGGLKLSEPAADLGVIMALVSSYKNMAIDSKTIILGEVGLAGEIRGIGMAEQRVREAAKLGFTTCILPKSNVAAVKQIQGIKILGVENVAEAIDYIK